MNSRRGISIAECVILICVVLIVFGAIFSTLSSASRNYTNASRNVRSRVTLFNWVQAFESMWPNIYPTPIATFEKVAQALNGTWDHGSGQAYIEGFRVEAFDRGIEDGSLVVAVTIHGDVPGRPPFASVERHYNAFSNETVSDDAVQVAP